jgi:hypothetical protein
VGGEAGGGGIFVIVAEGDVLDDWNGGQASADVFSAFDPQDSETDECTSCFIQSFKHDL